MDQEIDPHNDDRAIQIWPKWNFAGPSTFTFKVKDSSGHVSDNAYTVTLVRQLPTPSAPQNLTATTSDAQVTLTWTDPNDSTITHYQHETKFVGDRDFGVWKNIPGSNKDTTTFTATGLENGKEYEFTIRAVNANGEGSYSRVRATPLGVAKPSGLTAVIGSGRVTLGWTDPNDADVAAYEYQQRRPLSGRLGTLNWRAPSNKDQITRYQYRTRQGSNTWTSWKDICVQASDATCKDTTTYAVHDVVIGNRYMEEVRYMTGATSTNVKLVAQEATLTSSSGGNVQLEWRAATQVRYFISPHPVSKYQYQYNTGGSWPANWTDVPCVWPCNLQTLGSYVVPNLTGNTAYTFRMRAVFPEDVTWAMTIYSERKGPNTAYAETWPVEWNAISGSGANSTTTVVTGLANGTTYDFRIRAKSAVAPGPVSDSVQVLLVKPSPPANLRATPGDSRVTLSWSDPKDSTITRYQYQYKLSASSTWGGWQNMAGSGATTTSPRRQPAHQQHQLHLPRPRGERAGQRNLVRRSRDDAERPTRHARGAHGGFQERVRAAGLERSKPGRRPHNQVPVPEEAYGRLAHGLDGRTVRLALRGHQHPDLFLREGAFRPPAFTTSASAPSGRPPRALRRQRRA